MDKAPEVSQPKSFSYLSNVTFAQLDLQGILHHSRHFLHVEDASHAFFSHVMGADGFDTARWPDQNAVVRRMNIDYMAPLSKPGRILVVLRILRLRACAMNTSFELRSADGTVLYSKGMREICRVDGETLRPVIWSDEYRRRFRAWVVKPVG